MDVKSNSSLAQLYLSSKSSSKSAGDSELEKCELRASSHDAKVRIKTGKKILSFDGARARHRNHAYIQIKGEFRKLVPGPEHAAIWNEVVGQSPAITVGMVKKLDERVAQSVNVPSGDGKSRTGMNSRDAGLKEADFQPKKMQAQLAAHIPPGPTPPKQQSLHREQTPVFFHSPANPMPSRGPASGVKASAPKQVSSPVLPLKNPAIPPDRCLEILGDSFVGRAAKKFTNFESGHFYGRLQELVEFANKNKPELLCLDPSSKLHPHLLEAAEKVFADTRMSGGLALHMTLYVFGEEGLLSLLTGSDRDYHKQLMKT